MSSLSDLVAIGEKFGLSGAALQEFVMNEQAKERDLRHSEREESSKLREIEWEIEQARKDNLEKEIQLRSLPVSLLLRGLK